MMTAADLPDVIPIFPLPQALLLPRGRLPLHIFEPRYLAMVEDVLKTPHRLIGMIQPVPGGAGTGLHRIGCAGRMTGFSETEDGRYMITLAGISRFRVQKQVEGFTPYRRVEAGWDDFARDLGPGEGDPKLDRTRFFALLDRYLDEFDLRTDWDALREAEDETLINALAMLCPFEVEDKQALLESPTLTERRETLQALMEFALHTTAGQEDKMQ